MYPPKLKIQIVVTFFGILVSVMLLINIVMFVFWYQHLVQQKVEQVKNTVYALQSEGTLLDSSAGSATVNSSLRMLHSALGRECRQVLMLQDGHARTTIDSQDQWGLEALVFSASTSGEEVIQYIDKKDIPFFYTPKVIAIALPVDHRLMKRHGIGVVLDTTSTLSDLWAKEKVIAVYIFINALIFTIIGFFRMRSVVFVPIETLVTVAENYHVSEGGGLFAAHPENEFGQLSRAMNNMVHRIEEDRKKLYNTVDCLAETNIKLKSAQNEIIRAERLAMAGRLSAALAHEIGNPVTIVQGYVELLEKSDLSGKERFEFSSRALEELSRIDRLLRQFLDVTRVKDVRNEALDPASILLDAIQALEISFKKKHIEVLITVPEKGVRVWGDKESLRQICLNCLINALDAVADKYRCVPGGEVSAIVKVVTNEGNDLVVLEFNDNGSGIEKDDLEYIFEPFFTTKDPGRGTGLGLAVSYGMIHSMNGIINVESERGKGALFRVTLPRYVESPAVRKEEKDK